MEILVIERTAQFLRTGDQIDSRPEVIVEGSVEIDRNKPEPLLRRSLVKIIGIQPPHAVDVDVKTIGILQIGLDLATGILKYHLHFLVLPMPGALDNLPVTGAFRDHDERESKIERFIGGQRPDRAHRGIIIIVRYLDAGNTRVFRLVSVPEHNIEDLGEVIGNGLCFRMAKTGTGQPFPFGVGMDDTAVIVSDLIVYDIAFVTRGNHVQALLG